MASSQVIASENTSVQLTQVDDGPYIFEHAIEGKQAHWICKNQLVSQNSNAKVISNNSLANGILINNSVPEITFLKPDQCQSLSTLSVTVKPTSVDKDEYQNIESIVALSDIHGRFDVLITLLRNHQIIDEDNDWLFGKGHMVITGDVFDRGRQVNEVLWLLYKLEKQALSAGGRLHLLMGNHEQMVLRGDLRYVDDKYNLAETLLNRSYDQLYNQKTHIGQWLRSKNTIVKLNNTLFLHGGISTGWLQHKLNITEANQLLRAHIDDNGDDIKSNDVLEFLFRSNGPTWYRGFFDDEYSEKSLNQLLKYFGVNRFVVGHTTQTQVLGLFDNKVIAVDSGIKNGESGELLFINNNKLTRGFFNGKRQVLH